MTTPNKALFAALATGAMVLSAAAPAMAQDGWRNGGDYDRGHGFRGDSSRHAIAACTRVAERQASRGGFGRARVTDVRDVRDTRWGYEVRGRIVVNSHDRGWNDRGYNDRGYNDRSWNDRSYGRGWGDNRRHDTGLFTCRVARGRVAYLDIDGIRGL